ncbi:MAG: hybrid sensor histidine kinase/response regulator [Leptolyngbyaceae cyanobacterium bins.59]|nr:hybrid sensor histidine kinase/response regulator [Leptolyngbyaceae cyanobacterium bins.59]
MQQNSLQVLLVEDSPTDAQLFQHVFLRAGDGYWKLFHVERLSEAIDFCQTQSFQVALLDLGLPDSDGLETIAQFHLAVPDIPIIILTMLDDEELALQAMAQGAQDYLVKDQVTTQLLRRSIRYTLERSQILQKLKDNEQTTLKALDKERELNQLKTYFISMVSHEFRNPLTVLRALSEMLFRFDGKLTPEKKELYLQQVNGAIKHMCQLLDEVIFLGGVESGKFELDVAMLDLKSFCDELMTACEFSDNHQHPIILHYQSDTTQVELDYNLLRHILTNLLSNALKYSPPGNEVQLEVQPGKGVVCFRVIDCGIGIPDVEQYRLFEAFSRCSNVGRIEGTGLGLAIVKRCIDLQGGKIAIESNMGMGTIVTVSIPTRTLALQ